MSSKFPASKSSAKNSKGIEITGDGRYPLISIDKIEIVERPEDGQEEKKLFFNPRSLSSFTPQEMFELRQSIRTDGLQSPPIVRVTTNEGVPVKVELIAGERRFRSLQYIVENDLPCFEDDLPRPSKFKAGQIVISKGKFGKVVSHKDVVTIQILDHDNNLTDEQQSYSAEDVYPTMPGSKLYKFIPCKVHYDISDARALRLAFTENDKAKSLSTMEEIALVERLQRADYKVAEIAEMLGSNDTWVSQTANFRNDLPSEAFDCLIKGNMKRHTAVKIMSYKLEDRDSVWQSTVEAEAEDRKSRIEDAQSEAEQAQDEEILALHEKKQALKAGDHATAKKAARKAASASKKSAKALEKKEKAESETGHITTSHVQKGAAKAGVSAKKAKLLPKEEIEQYYVEALEEFLEGDGIDPICQEEVPGDLAAVVRLTALAILSGNRDGLAGIRQHMLDQGEWKLKKKNRKRSDDDDDDDDDDDSDLDDDDDFDEEEAFDPSDDDLDALDDDGYSDDDDDFVRDHCGGDDDFED